MRPPLAREKERPKNYWAVTFKFLQSPPSPLQEQAAKALNADKILCGKRVRLKKRNDRQSPVAGRFASLWKNGRAHLSGEAAGKQAKISELWRDITK